MYILQNSEFQSSFFFQSSQSARKFAAALFTELSTELKDFIRSHAKIRDAHRLKEQEKIYRRIP